MTRGRWGTSTLTLSLRGSLVTYEVEYRRPEPGCPAGYYLFGDGFTGKALTATDIEMARLEAFAYIVERWSHVYSIEDVVRFMVDALSRHGEKFL